MLRKRPQNSDTFIDFMMCVVMFLGFVMILTLDFLLVILGALTLIYSPAFASDFKDYYKSTLPEKDQ